VARVTTVICARVNWANSLPGDDAPIEEQQRSGRHGGQEVRQVRWSCAGASPSSQSGQGRRARTRTGTLSTYRGKPRSWYGAICPSISGWVRSLRWAS
jgi:hypothetical protein